MHIYKEVETDETPHCLHLRALQNIVHRLLSFILLLRRIEHAYTTGTVPSTGDARSQILFLLFRNLEGKTEWSDMGNDLGHVLIIQINAVSYLLPHPWGTTLNTHELQEEKIILAHSLWRCRFTVH